MFETSANKCLSVMLKIPVLLQHGYKVPAKKIVYDTQTILRDPCFGVP